MAECVMPKTERILTFKSAGVGNVTYTDSREQVQVTIDREMLHDMGDPTELRLVLDTNAVISDG